MIDGLGDDDLPSFWRDADAASLRGQRWTLRYGRIRLLGSVVAAFGGAIAWQQGRVNVAACIIALGFIAALVSEVLSWSHQPERLWYQGRAFAESAKTLSWRYAVGAEPFPVSMSVERARELFRSRLQDVSHEFDEAVIVASSDRLASETMEQLRAEPFPVRRSAYLEGRTVQQHRWYAAKAAFNLRAATAWRIFLVSAEIVAVVLAALRVFGEWDVDFAGILAAVIASGAAWVAIKQYSSLAAAYSTTARELAIQADRLRAVTERDWPRVVADAEEAISREHTLWVASRTGRQALT